MKGNYTGKRLFDLIVSGTALLALSPLFVVLAVMVKLSDGGPVFFMHRRIGRNFVPFRMYKFRTMVVNADKAGPEITVGGDSRITRIGRLLRMTKTDELPQLLNVLKGEMSIVGPRPEVEKYVERFRREYEDVLAARPGITDHASIEFRDEEAVLAGADDPDSLYVDVVLPRKLSLNREYINNMTFAGDVRLIIRTFMAL
jgi:lipopolysaccharide/colanic/teichoic acid biosynthesis glycosyltransferase